jgi:hypothetical protein
LTVAAEVDESAATERPPKATASWLIRLVFIDQVAVAIPLRPPVGCGAACDQRTLRHGMAAAGRYLSLRLRLPDRPGVLAALLQELSVADANVLTVNHVRTDPRLGIEEAEVELQLETQGPSHCAAVARALRSAGYTVLD